MWRDRSQGRCRRRTTLAEQRAEQAQADAAAPCRGAQKARDEAEEA